MIRTLALSSIPSPPSPPGLSTQISRAVSASEPDVPCRSPGQSSAVCLSCDTPQGCHTSLSVNAKKYESHGPMNDREVTRWQHNRIYPQPISLCEYTNDLIFHLQIFIWITIVK